MLSKKIYDLAKRRGIFWSSFGIYGGVSGFYDYGPIGALLKENIIAIWKEYYVIREGFALIDTPVINPEEVFKASEHLKQFTDYISYCKTCGSAYRIDELIKEKVPEFEVTNVDDISKAINQYNIRCTNCGGELTIPTSVNLMFSTKIGMGEKKDAYLRPETAQGIFINILPLYRYVRENVPFGVVQIGKGFRNEIAPRQGLLRLREFNMAEAEVFFDPANKTWPRFEQVSNLKIHFITKEKIELMLSIKEAVSSSIISSEALGYFIGLTYQFLTTLRIPPEKIRFRQHTKSELAHYSIDCWDCEIFTSYDWIEVAGIADRGVFDISKHSASSSRDLRITVPLKEVVSKTYKKYETDEKVLRTVFKERAKRVIKYIESLEVHDEPLKIHMDGQEFIIPKEGYKIVEHKEKVSTKKVIPNIIEPSYGIDRILYCVLEHAYYEREDTGYRVLRLTPRLAPIKVTVFPLMSKDELVVEAEQIYTLLSSAGINAYYEDKGSIGKRYARADEIGVPFNITIDYQTLEDHTVTIRDRDSTQQVRVHVDVLTNTIKKLIAEELSFEKL